VLRWWIWDEAAPAEPEVTPSLVECRFTGRSGCNRYSTAAMVGAMPGEVSLGAVISTRMACVEPVGLIERRFLDQLGGATRNGFMSGRLALTDQTDGATGTMLFDTGSDSGPS
jgi:heat shock protein HslJ